MSPYLAEYLGTLILIVLGDGVVAAVVLKQTKSENAGWLTVVIGWGLAVTLSIYAVGQYSGAHINPAVTLALAYSGSFSWELVPGYCLAQLAGAFTGAIVVWLHYYLHWKVTHNPAEKLAVFCTGPAIRSNVHNLISEIIGTAVLILGLLTIGANKFTEA